MISDPQTILGQAGIKPNEYIADLGAGTGAFAIAAGRFAREGKVYAIEVQKDLLGRIKDDAFRAGLTNIEAIWGDIERPGGTKLKEGAVDLVILANVLFQVQNKGALASEVKRILKEKGRVLIVDWKDSFGGLGPTGAMLASAESMKTIFSREGFQSDREIEAGEHHYGIILKKP